MYRTFQTNKIRNVRLLSGSQWTFEPLTGPHRGRLLDVVVPCLWETIPDYAGFRGQARFTREFEGKGDVRILCKGVSHTGVVEVDGKELGSHYNAYTEFSVIARGLAEGKHTLTITVDNTFSEKSALHIPNDYMTYGGINRDVIMESLNEAFIERVHAIPQKTDEGWNVSLRIRVKNLTAKAFMGDLKVEIPGIASLTEGIAVEAAGSTELITEMPVRDVTLWSPENPVLYFVEAILQKDGKEVDDLIERIGFREIRISGKNILLNGRRLRIKGFCRHEDHPIFANALPLQLLDQDLQIVRSLGGNAVRTSHYPNDERFLDLCDEKGIILWEENHARGLTEEMMRNPNFEKQAEDCIKEMIDAHMNHPSILIWGILNECASETQYGYECYKRQYALVKKMDASRPMSSASCKFKTDICFGMPDIVSYNIYPEWYVDEPAADYLKSLYDWVQEESEGSGKPFLITETGAGAIYGLHYPDTMDKWSEEYQAQALRNQLRAVFAQEGCSGVFIWQFADCRICREWFATRPRTMNNKGIVDEYRRRKLSYEVVKELFHSVGNYFDET